MVTSHEPRARTRAPLASFHPIVQRWFTDEIGTPTPGQARGWAAIRDGRHTLIAAPTGSGKTLAAFLIALDDLLQEGLAGPLPDEVRVVYVSPLKALSSDIHKNLAEPRAAIERLAAELGFDGPRITAAVRTGDTSPAERAAMIRTPPHILVTTPESLYLLLTAGHSRDRLRHVRTVIVDEIHAVIGTRRGAHLALSLERLAHVSAHPVQRIGLSATQRPVEAVARFLVGSANVGADGRADCVVVDEGHRRATDLALELPRIAARGGDVARSVGGVLRSPGRARSPDIAPRWCSSTRARWSSAWRGTCPIASARTPSPRITAACRRSAASTPNSG